MIRTVADLLSEVVHEKLPLLDGSGIKHAPTIGDMYEGLSTEVLRRALPEGLNLTVGTGFVRDELGGTSGQLDCVIANGDGERIPYTNAYIWNIHDVIAVVEVKKTLHSSQLADALDQLRTVFAVQQSALNSARAQATDVRPALKSFAESTGRLSPRQGPIAAKIADQALLGVLVDEQLSVIRVVLGLHGFRSERAFRTALLNALKGRIRIEGFGPGGLPQLIISGNYSLVKANGRPYSARLTQSGWPFYFSTPVNPLLILLELVWSRLDEMFDLPGLWGEDLESEVGHALLIGTADSGGWHITAVDATQEQLENVPVTEPWRPSYVSLEEFVLFQRLRTEGVVKTDDPKLLNWLQQHSIDVSEIRHNLISTGLVAANGNELHLIANACECAILPTGEFVVAENNTGRLSRWLSTMMENRTQVSE